MFGVKASEVVPARHMGHVGFVSVCLAFYAVCAELLGFLSVCQMGKIAYIS